MEPFCPTFMSVWLQNEWDGAAPRREYTAQIRDALALSHQSNPLVPARRCLLRLSVCHAAERARGGEAGGASTQRRFKHAATERAGEDDASTRPRCEHVAAMRAAAGGGANHTAADLAANGARASASSGYDRARAPGPPARAATGTSRGETSRRRTE